VSNTFASALWALEFCFTLAQNGATRVNFHRAENGHGYTAYDGNGNMFEVLPEFYGISLFSKMAHGFLLTTKTTGSANGLLAYAVAKTDSPLNVLLANNSRSEIVRLKLLLPPGRLTAPRLDSTSKATLGRTQISFEGTWTFQCPDMRSIDLCRCAREYRRLRSSQTQNDCHRYSSTGFAAAARCSTPLRYAQTRASLA
jgi:hypothetical protein